MCEGASIASQATEEHHGDVLLASLTPRVLLGRVCGDQQGKCWYGKLGQEQHSEHGKSQHKK